MTKIAKPAAANYSNYQPATAAHRVLKFMLLGADTIGRIDASLGFASNVGERYVLEFVANDLVTMVAPENSRKNIAKRHYVAQLTERGIAVANWLNTYEEAFLIKKQINEMRRDVKRDLSGMFRTPFLGKLAAVQTLRGKKFKDAEVEVVRLADLTKMEKQVAAYTTQDIVAEFKDVKDYVIPYLAVEFEVARTRGIAFADDAEFISDAILVAKISL